MCLTVSINLIVERHLMEKGCSERSVQYFLEGSAVGIMGLFDMFKLRIEAGRHKHTQTDLY